MRQVLTAESLLKLTQLPLGILLWRSSVLPFFQQQLDAWGGGAASPAFVSLQLGWLHLAQPVLSRAIERMVKTAVRTGRQHPHFTTVIAR